MVNTKYGKYILRDIKGPNLPPAASSIIAVNLEGQSDWGGIQHRMKWSFVTRPVLLGDEPHWHDFDEFFCFFSSDPAHERDFGAEIEITLGKELEKQTIHNPAVVCIPRGLVHGPVNFKAINHPVLFCNIYTAPEYIKKPLV